MGFKNQPPHPRCLTRLGDYMAAAASIMKQKILLPPFASQKVVNILYGSSLYEQNTCFLSISLGSKSVGEIGKAGPESDGQ